MHGDDTVAETHLTLPTKRIVEISVVAESRKKKLREIGHRREREKNRENRSPPQQTPTEKRKIEHTEQQHTHNPTTRHLRRTYKQ